VERAYRHTTSREHAAAWLRTSDEVLAAGLGVPCLLVGTHLRQPP
jgi:hypothetical protein